MEHHEDEAEEMLGIAEPSWTDGISTLDIILESFSKDRKFKIKHRRVRKDFLSGLAIDIWIDRGKKLSWTSRLPIEYRLFHRNDKKTRSSIFGFTLYCRAWTSMPTIGRPEMPFSVSRCKRYGGSARYDR